MKSLLSRARSERGMSLFEMLVVIIILATVTSMATAELQTVRRSMQGDGAMRLVMSQLTTAREMAVTQRRTMEVKFVTGVSGNWIQIWRNEVTGPNPQTRLTNVAFEGNVVYKLIPTITTDTPDGFGNTGALAFGTANRYTFSTDGTLIDQSGNPLNGTVFLAVPNILQSQRAVTVMGSIGRVRGYKWTGGSWKRV
jgi:prepilin-type N-terminal cleavage/methylation domain-containing protein